MFKIKMVPIILLALVSSYSLSYSASSSEYAEFDDVNGHKFPIKVLKVHPWMDLKNKHYEHGQLHVIIRAHIENLTDVVRGYMLTSLTASDEMINNFAHRTKSQAVIDMFEYHKPGDEVGFSVNFEDSKDYPKCFPYLDTKHFRGEVYVQNVKLMKEADTAIDSIVESGEVDRIRRTSSVSLSRYPRELYLEAMDDINTGYKSSHGSLIKQDQKRLEEWRAAHHPAETLDHSYMKVTVHRYFQKIMNDKIVFVN